MTTVASNPSEQSFINDLPLKKTPPSLQQGQAIPRTRHQQKIVAPATKGNFFKKPRSCCTQRKSKMTNKGTATPSGPLAKVPKASNNASTRDLAARERSSL